MICRLKLILVIFAVVLVKPINLFARENSVISKSDAEMMFSLSLQDWIDNAVGLKNAGLAEVDTNGSDEYTLIYNTAEAKVVVTPSYGVQGETNKPWKISLGMVFNQETSKRFIQMDEEQIKSFIASIYEEMLPEYTVFSNFIFDGSSVVHDVQLFKAGYDEVVDEYAEMTRGCFQECVQYISETTQQPNPSSKSYFDETQKAVFCEQPLPPFTLGPSSKPTKLQVEQLCKCLWDALPENGWERELSKSIISGGTAGQESRIEEFSNIFGENVFSCGGSNL